MSSTTVILPKMYSLGYRCGATLATLGSRSLERPSPDEMWQAITSLPGLYKEWWWNLLATDPIHVAVETTLLVSIAYILISSRRRRDWRKSSEKLTPAEEEELLAEWKATRAPLTATYDEDEEEEEAMVVHELRGRRMLVEVAGVKREVLNFATFDFLGMGDDDLPGVQTVKEAAHTALDRYGCGSCGPRGFYGTIDVHLQLETAMAEFCGTEQAILYSDGASTCSSTVAAFAKRGDLLVVDDGIYEPLMTGVTLSRAHVKWFKHNDMADLRRVLEQVAANDRKIGRPLSAQRRFIVVEGLYKNTGSIVPLDELVKLKHEFSYRLILDESFSFGTLGSTGRGVVDLYNKKLMYDAEIVTVGLENAVGSVGGLTIGTEEVVDHQRLCGSGYCFSASVPPFTAQSAMAALKLMEGKELLERLSDNRSYMYEKLKTAAEKMAVVEVTSDERSPIVVLQVKECKETKYLDEQVFCQEVVRECIEGGVAMVATGGVRVEVPPAIRMTLSASQTHADVDKALAVLEESVEAVMTRFREESM